MNITEYAMFKKLFGKGGGGSGGDPTPLQEKHMTVAKNGTHIVTPDPGYALSKATVTVAVPEKPAITDVDIFPNPDSGFIDELDKQSTYRLSAGIYAHETEAKTKQQFGNTHIVDELPEVGEPCTLDGVNINAVYYNRADGTAYAYVSDEIAPALGVPADWYDAGLLLQSLGYTYGGVVTNVGSMTDIGTFYFLANTSYFAYSDEAWVEFAPVVGGGGGADNSIVGTWVFNDEITAPEEIRNKTYYFGFVVGTPNDGIQQMGDFVVMYDEENNFLYLSYYSDVYTLDDAYDGEFGWSEEMYKKIIITKPPTDEAFIDWLKENATKIA